jgi:NAD(P)-dependent dehydrogenase (short-subunit alcohol dehydrogenase family)
VKPLRISSRRKERAQLYADCRTIQSKMSRKQSVMDGGEAVAFGGDISEEHSARECVDLAVKKFNRLDVLVDNAGVFLDNAMTQDYPIGDFDETIRMNNRRARWTRRWKRS